MPRLLRRGASIPQLQPNWLVDPTGSDSNGGKSASAAFATLSKAMTSASAGQRVALKRGATWRETLAASKANMRFSAYGAGAAPIISGGTQIANTTASWTSGGTNLWYTASVTVEPILVTFDGTRGARRHYRDQATQITGGVTIASALTANADWWWDARNSRLYVRCTTNPASTWSVIEYAARVSPVQVTATGVRIAGIMISHHNLDDGTNGISQGTYAPALVGITTQHLGSDAVTSYWNRPGRHDSLWNKRLTGAETLVAPPSGFTSIPIQLADWPSPKMGVRIVQATGSDPLVSLYYSFDAFNNVYNGTWARYGNSTAIESAIMSGASATWQNPRFIYATTSTTSGVGTMPTDPLWQPLPNPNPGPFQFRCPANLQPPPDSDGYTVVFQPDGTAVELYCPVVLSANRVVAFGFSVTPPGGDISGRAGGTTASMNPTYAGVIRDGEMSAAGSNIPHAIAIYLPESHLKKQAVLPALTWDRTNSYSGTLAMGTRLALPTTINVGTTQWGTTAGHRIAQAAQDYGCIVVDRNGGTGMTFKSQHMPAIDTAYADYWSELWYDLDYIRANLKVVA